MSKEKFYITTAIAYTSKKPHIGNTYEIVLTDAIARFNRFIGKDVFFLTGTDEHGQKIQEIAENEGITPKQHVDKIAGQIKDIADMLNISYDKFIRTTDDYHVKAVQQIFKKLYDQGDIYKSEYERAPKIIPLYSHRYIVDVDDDKNMKILSIAGSDIICYSDNLESYLQIEFKIKEFDNSVDCKNIPFWSNLIYG